ncbi:unnamed protein product [Ceutorhynchus assimilis]|uniref:Uncharacterized protein n=1 Tax=Ceutorhynchus assimilis TaxID=467358 RepID=A0A9N9QAZ1_9CUCU|nr:unnamed protein product [Ceutorhynchus assimilis]
MTQKKVMKKVKIMLPNAIYLALLASFTTAFNLQDFVKAEEVNVASKVPRSINSNHQGVENKETTIKEVEHLIRSNPDLPRLTRGEILDILDNITKQDEINLVGSNNRDPKALMVVKAYTPLGSGEINFEELYTKPPLTSIVDDETTTTENVRPKPSTDKFYVRKKPSRGQVQFKATTSTERLITRGQTITTPERLTTRGQTTTTPETSTTRRRRIRPTRTTTTMMPTTYRPRRRQPPRKEIQYSNHKYPLMEQSRYSSQGIRIVPPPSMASEINSELEDLLPQEGEHKEQFMPMSNNTSSTFSEPSIELEIPDHLKQVVADLNLGAIRPTENKKAEKVLASIGVSTQASPNADAIADSLSPDMQELLKSFGLLPQQDKKNELESQFSPEKAETNPESYIGFKPLPEDNIGRKDMEELLTQFGLLDHNERNGRTLKTAESLKLEQISLEAVPDDLKSVLHDMGFEPTRVERKIRDLKEPIKASKHIFKPDKVVPDEELQKLARLMEIMKKLELKKGNITEEDLKQINKEDLKDLVASLKQHNGPNPIEDDLGLEKNAFKRQETTTQTMETITPSMKDLEDSFGGSSETVTESLPETTTAKRSGFYYLLDLNTFLEIDDQKGKRVNLRFQPKVGDPKSFYSVNVP